MKYILVTLFYFILITLFVQTLVYNIILSDIVSTSYSIFVLFFFIYIIYITLILSKEYNHRNILSYYFRIIRFIMLALLISTILLFVKDMTLLNELNLFLYFKNLIFLLITSIVISLIYFLEVSFYKYRILWLVCFIGTILFTPLLVESEMFLRDLRIRSLLNFWNLIVPYKAIEQLRQFVLLEEWQGWEIALFSAIHLLIYWFVVVSVCLYIRQFQVNWGYKIKLSRVMIHEKV